MKEAKRTVRRMLLPALVGALLLPGIGVPLSAEAGSGQACVDCHKGGGKTPGHNPGRSERVFIGGVSPHSAGSASAPSAGGPPPGSGSAPGGTGTQTGGASAK
ncbi:MAG: hypothetical protein Kow00128_07590 [Deltaproteobacteria bacterium]